MASRLIKVDGNNLYCDTSAGAFSVTGDDTGESLSSGRLKVKGTYIYYGDYSDNERRKQGVLTGDERPAGSIYMTSNSFLYGDINDDEREITAAGLAIFRDSTANPKYGAMVAEITDATWAVIRADVGDAKGSATQSGISFVSTGSDGIWGSLYRYIFAFKSAPDFPADATITAAKVRLKGAVQTVNELSISPYVNLVDVTLDDPPNIGEGDFNSFGTTGLSTAKAYTNWLIDDWNEFELNQDGIDLINKDGYTHFGFIETIYDLAGTTPTWSASDSLRIRFYGPVLGVAEKMPQLVVTYT